MLSLFEQLRTVHEYVHYLAQFSSTHYSFPSYRTSGSMRSALMVLLYLAPIMLAPLFANYAASYGRWAAIWVAAVVAFQIRALGMLF